MAEIQRVVPFSARDVSHWNRLRNALVNVFSISDDAQAYIQLAQLLFGDGGASITKDGSNNMVLTDPEAGTHILDDLGGAAVAGTPLFLGYTYDGGAAASIGVANAVVLTPVWADGPVTVTDMQVYVNDTSSENMQMGVYSEAGVLLKKTNVVTPGSTGIYKVPLQSSLSIVTGRFWLALTIAGTTAAFKCQTTASQPRNCKRVTRGSWAELPDPISIPSTVYQGDVPSVIGVVSGGIY